jgi:hypothetical protein
MLTANRCGGPIVRRACSLMRFFAIAAGIALLAPSGVRADTLSPFYDAAQLPMSGDLAGMTGTRIPQGSDLFVEGLTEDGRITFSAAPNHSTQPAMLLQWANGGITPIVFPGGSRSPHWPLDVYWPQNVRIDRPVRANAKGNVVFSIGSTSGSGPRATYWWDAGNQTTIPVRLKDEPATGNLVFTNPSGATPAINNQDEIALIGQVSNPNGPSGFGLFSLEQFPGSHQVLRPVVLPGENMPVRASGLLPALTGRYFRPSIDDNGRIAFLVQLRGTAGHSAYVWEYGANNQLMISGNSLPSGARIMNVGSVSLNNQDRSALLTAMTNRAGYNRYGLYRALNGAITTIVEPGAAMPGGGTLQTVQYASTEEESVPRMGVSEPTASGLYVFLATLTDGSTGAYRLDRDGTVTPIFRTNPRPGGAVIADNVPTLTLVPGSRPCINNHGKIALSVRRSNNASVILLLTPIER